jgi:hypothetical protein
MMMYEKGGLPGWTYVYRRRMCLINDLIGQKTVCKSSRVGGKYDVE